MRAKGSGFGDLPIAAKLNIVLLSAIITILGLAGTILSQWLGAKIEERSMADLRRTNQQVVDMMDAYASVLERSAEMLGAQFAATLPKRLVLDSAHLVATAGGDFPTLRGDYVLNNNASSVDAFSATTGAVATIFVRKGDDFVRIATSLKKENGERAVGTPLGSRHPAFSLASAGMPYTGRATLFGREFMTRYLPLKDESGHVIGIAFIGIDFTESLAVLKKKILALKVGETGYVFVLDAAKEPGKALVHPAAEGKNLIEAKDSDGRLFVKEMIEMKQGHVRYPWMNSALGDTSPRDKIAVIDHFPRWGVVVGSGSYLDEFTRDVRGVQIQLAIAGGMIGMVLVGVVFFATRNWLSKPLREALAVTRRVSEGDLTVSVQALSRDEVGQLLDATDQMCTHLRRMIAEVNGGIGTLVKGVKQMAAASEEVASCSGKQSDAAAAMAAAIEEMTVSIERVSQLSHEARDMAHSSGEVSDNGVAVIDCAIKEMGTIAATVRESSGAVVQLGGQSQQIASIVNVIREIADQTNLLALNAAIEAARAGEQGRGFAVVADEVRKLAERTTQSTGEITNMVSRIQGGAKNAVDSMNVGVSQVEAGVELANKAGVSIAEIKTSAAGVGCAVVGISEALREQTAASQDIARNVEHIAQQAEHNHAQAKQTSEAATSLEVVAERLRQSIAQFKT